MTRHQVLADILAEKIGAPVLQGKGGFWVKGGGFISLAKARRITGIPGAKRPIRLELTAGGDWGFVGMLNKAMVQGQ